MSEVDYYDVQNMIRDARSEIRGEIDRAISELRRDIHESLADLREGLSNESQCRHAEIEQASASLQRVIDSRTAHLA